MAAAAILSITLVPVLMGYLIRGRIRPEAENPINRVLIAVYRPALDAVLRHPRITLALAGAALLLSLLPLSKLGSEFMPPLDEGTLLSIPTPIPGPPAGTAGTQARQE